MTVLLFHRHEPAITITKRVGVKIENTICPCKVCGEVMEFSVADLAEALSVDCMNCGDGDALREGEACAYCGWIRDEDGT